MSHAVGSLRELMRSRDKSTARASDVRGGEMKSALDYAHFLKVSQEQNELEDQVLEELDKTKSLLQAKATVWADELDTCKSLHTLVYRSDADGAMTSQGSAKEGQEGAQEVQQIRPRARCRVQRVAGGMQPAVWRRSADGDVPSSISVLACSSSSISRAL